ncbi:PAS domain S-box protein [candidate division GN15 bacterium]|nr:PAS domain S-box protein [candidate division GN15 bacterium]
MRESSNKTTTRGGSSAPRAGFDSRLMAVLAVGLIVVVIGVTLVSIHNSRSASFELLEAQGTAITETLAQAAENAIKSEMFYDRLVQARYADLVASLVNRDVQTLSDQDLVMFALSHDLMGVHAYDSTGELMVGAVPRGAYIRLPDFVENEVVELLSEPEQNYVLLLEPTDGPGEMRHYYLELTPTLDMVVVIETDALYYSEAVQETGIGYLAQRMAGEPGVEYVAYQTTDGIIFASRKVDELLAIESDPFLSRALESDTIAYRTTSFQDKDVVEFVRPFSTEKFPFGLFRVGVSLEGFNSIKGEFRTQMLVFSGTLIALLLVGLLYINARRRRRELRRQYEDIKSITDTVFAQMETGVAAIDAGGEIRVANSAFEQAFGVRDVTGKSWREALGERASLIDELLPDKSDHREEKEITLEQDGATKVLLVAMSRMEPPLGETGDSPAVVIVVYDITRLKEFEQQAARKERLSEMGNLAAGVAHEIRNPLNTISIAAQRLAAEFSVSEDQDQFTSFTKQIRTETKRLNEIITRFLALAREDKKKEQTVRLDELIYEMNGLLQMEAQQVGLDLSMESEPDITVRGDRDQLKEVFLNLFNNAKEAMAGLPGSFNVVARRDGDHVLIATADNGPGIPPDAADKVFAPYYTTKEAGTGLGLPTVQRIIEEMGGEISLERDFEEGALFLIRLPLVG